MAINIFQSKYSTTFQPSNKMQKQLEHISTNILPDKLYSNKPEPRFGTFLLVYLKLSYYICYSPFKIVNDLSGEFTVKFNRIQRTLCLFLNTSGFILRFAEFRQSIFELTRGELVKNPAVYFRIASTVVSIVFQITGFYRLWYHFQDYVDILNFSIRHSNSIPKGNKIILSQAFSFCLFVSYFCFALHQVFYMYIIAPSSYSEIRLWTKELDPIERYIFSIANGTLTESISPAANITWLDYVSAVFVVIGKCNR